MTEGWLASPVDHHKLAQMRGFLYLKYFCPEMCYPRQEIFSLINVINTNSNILKWTTIASIRKPYVPLGTSTLFELPGVTAVPSSRF